MSFPLITYAEAFAFLHLGRQASIYTSKSYTDPLIKASECINLMLGISASEVRQSKSEVQVSLQMEILLLQQINLRLAVVLC